MNSSSLNIPSIWTGSRRGAKKCARIEDLEKTTGRRRPIPKNLNARSRVSAEGKRAR